MPDLDLRSDTVTRPNPAMRAAMAAAKVGDDVYEDDPGAIELQQIAAELSGKQDALFVSSGTQSNLIALLCHCQRGEEYIVGQQAHTYKYEAGGAAVLGSIQPQPIEFEADGSLNLKKVMAAIKPDDPHFAITRLLCIENTQSGKVIPQNYILQAAELCHQNGLNYHLDGARICNAAVASNTSIKALCTPFDSVSICLSKGLGAPIGSMLCGDQEFIHRAKRWRKMLGGGMRQVGIIAAAGKIALTENVERLADDHRRAKWLSQALDELPQVELKSVATNMVFVQFDKKKIKQIKQKLTENNILISIENNGESRLVLHLDVDHKKLENFIKIIAEI